MDAIFVNSEAAVSADLWSRVFSPMLEGRWWYALLERSGLQSQFTFLYALIRERGEPVGVAPCFLMNLDLAFVVPDRLRAPLTALAKLFPALRYTRILFVGSPCADEGAVGLTGEADRRAALLALQDALERKSVELDASVIVWKDFPASYDDDLAWVASQRGLFVMESFPGTVIEFKGPRREDYRAQLSSAQRYKLKKRLRAGESALRAEITCVQHLDDQTLDRIYALFCQTRDRADLSFEQIDRRFFAAAAELDNAHFVLIRDSESRAIVAFMLCFICGDRIINKYVGLDGATRREWFLLPRLMNAGVEFALSRGARAFQSGQTGYRSKLDSGHALVRLANYGKHRNWLIHRIFSFVARRISWQTLDPDLAAHVAAHPQSAPSRR